MVTGVLCVDTCLGVLIVMLPIWHVLLVLTMIEGHMVMIHVWYDELSYFLMNSPIKLRYG